MTLTSSCSVVQGYFPWGVPRQLLQQQPAAVQPSMNRGVRPAPTYQEMTIQAHLRTAGFAAQPRQNSNVFPLPQHLMSFVRRSGQKLPPTIQQKMESVFGADFSDVEVHVGPEASSIGALAFTRGADIHFAPGQYNPNSHFGQKLLAHELTHVLQQRAGRVRSPFSTGVAVVQDPALEAEAERMGTQAAMHINISPPPTRLTTPVQQSFQVRSPHGRAQLCQDLQASPPAQMMKRRASTEAKSKRPKKKQKTAQKKAVVTLTIGRGRYNGKSSSQWGHAEMQALRKFIMQYPTVEKAARGIKRAVTKTVDCPNQPVCGSCTLILQALGFVPAGTTVMSTKKSGGVAWGGNMKVQQLMDALDIGEIYQQAVDKGKK